jgi:hypothetical protein
MMQKKDIRPVPEDALVVYLPSAIFPQYLKVKSARKKVTRWLSVNSLATAETRARVMAQYLLYKMEKTSMHTKLRDNHFVKIRGVLENVDREYIKSEFTKHTAKSDVYTPISTVYQVESFRIRHHDVKDMRSMGTPFLQHWLNTLVDGIFRQKVYYDAFYFWSSHATSTEDEWRDCRFHEDIDQSPVEWDYNNIQDKAPISIYFPVGDTPIKLDIQYAKNRMGRPRKKDFMQLTMNPGDVLVFNTTSFRHRTAKPDLFGVPISDRVNVILTGYTEVIECG